MKSPTSSSSLWLCLFFTWPAFAQAQSVPVRDFTAKGFDYGYEEWKDLATVQTKTEKGVEINGSAKGGGGIFFAEALDLGTAKQLDISIKRGAGNTVEVLHLKIVSAQNKSQSWEIPLKDVSDTTFTTISLDLAKARAAGVNLGEIKQLQVQGNFNPEAKVDVEIASISATGTAEPATPPAPAK